MTQRARAARRSGAPRSSSAAAPPAIDKVAIGWSENAGVEERTYSSLWEADAALFRTFAASPPPKGGAYDKTEFVVTWTDGERHEGRLDVNERMLAHGAANGGMLRAHLRDLGRWLASDDHIRMFTGHRPAEELEQQRAWGAELLRRLDRDTAKLTAAGSRRNGTPPPYAGDGIPFLRVNKSAAAWLGESSSPATLLPKPVEREHELASELSQLFAGDIDWSDQRAHAFVNHLTLALRNDLPTIDARDAAVIWKKWRDAVVAFRAHHDRKYSVAITYRAMIVADDLALARKEPGAVFNTFCPWRSLYFDRDRVEPGSVGHRVRKSPWEVDSWRS